MAADTWFDIVDELHQLRKALQRIADGTWNRGTGKNLTAREFAQATLRTVQDRKH